MRNRRSKRTFSGHENWPEHRWESARGVDWDLEGPHDFGWTRVLVHGCQVEVESQLGPSDEM